MTERGPYHITDHLSKANRAQLDKGRQLHCTQCRRPFPNTAIYKHIHVLLCQACWYDLALAYQDNWPDWTAREYTLMNDFPGEAYKDEYGDWIAKE